MEVKHMHKKRKAKVKAQVVHFPPRGVEGRFSNILKAHHTSRKTVGEGHYVHLITLLLGRLGGQNAQTPAHA